MFKKAIITIIAISIILSLGWFLGDYFFNKTTRFRKALIENKDQSQPEIEEKEQNELKPEITIKEASVIAEGEIKTLIKLDKNYLIYYNQNNFLKTNLTGTRKENMKAYPFGDLAFIKCTFLAKNCFFYAKDSFFVYNMENNQAFKLEKKIKEVVFNSEGDGLVYLFGENNSYELNSSNLQGKNRIKLATIEGDNIKLVISPKNNNLIYYSRTIDESKNGIYLTNLIDEKEGVKIIKKDIIDADWSKDGKKILFSFYDKSTIHKRIQLGYYDLAQKKEYILGLPSITEKCVWSDNSNILYCGALTSSSDKTFTLDDWYSRQFVSTDVFWEINLKTGKKKRLFTDFEKYPEVDTFELTLFNNELVFIDKISGKLIRRNLED